MAMMELSQNDGIGKILGFAREKRDGEVEGVGNETVWRFCSLVLKLVHFPRRLETVLKMEAALKKVKQGINERKIYLVRLSLGQERR